MGFFDDAFDVLDKGVAATKSAVSSVAVEQNALVKSVARLCDDAASRGWHEANGGNVSVLLDPQQANQCRPYFYATPGSWVSLTVEVPELGGSFVLVTATGVCFRDVASDVVRSLGIVEISPTGSSWRIVWGFKDGGMPTSELGAHLQIFAEQRKRNNNAIRVVYHAHPANLIALSAIDHSDSRTLTRSLWKTMAECIIVAPRGIERLPWLAPGTPELAVACARVLGDADMALASNHGVFVSSPSVSKAFGVVETLEKVAGIRLAAMRISSDGISEIPDEGLYDIAARYNLPVRFDWL